MDKNAFAAWILHQAQAKVRPAVQHPLQLSGSTAQQTLQPVQNRTVEEMAGKFYLPHPGAYIAPVNHSRVATHQAPHQQNPETTTPNISSRYLLPVQAARG